MNKKEIFSRIADMLAKQFDIDKSKISGNLNFQKDLDADSIDFVEFVMNLQDQFHSHISDDDARKIQTVDEAVDYIAAHMNEDKK